MVCFNRSVISVISGYGKVNVIAVASLLPNPQWQIKLLQENNVQVVAMDGAPVAKLCWIFDTPWLVLHSVANVSGVEITESGTATASNNLGQVVVALVRRMPSIFTRSSLSINDINIR